MTTDVGKVLVEYLERPQGIAGRFTSYLAGNAIRIGSNSALGFYLREGMERMASEFVEWYEAKPEEVAEVNAWVEALPWNGVGYLVLAFNW